MRRVVLLCGISMASLFAAPASWADESDTVAAKFGARQAIAGASLSPDGTKVVLIAPRPEGGESATVVTLGEGKVVPLLTTRPGDPRITHCQFVLNERVVCNLYQIEGKGRDAAGSTRMFSVGTDGKDVKMLSAPTRSSAYFVSSYGGGIIDYNVEGKPTSVLMTRYNSVESQTGTMLGRNNPGYMVEAVDIITLKRSQVEAPKETASEYMTDGLGHVRIMALQPYNEAGYAREYVNYQYRPADGGGWQPLSRVTFDAGLSEGFEPYAVDPATNSAIGFDDANGRKGLYSRALDGSGTQRLLLGRSDVDVDDLLRIGRNQRIVGATYATERRVAEYFDPELKRLSGALRRAFPPGSQIDFLDASADEGKLMVLVGSDVDPGTLYLYDKGTRQLGSIMPFRPELAGVKLAEMKPVTYPAADGTLIPGYLTLPPGSSGKNLPAIVMPHGGPSARDEWGFDWLSQFFAARGYAVLQPNYRGSAGYGSGWFQKNGFQSWQTAIGDVNDAGRWLQAQGIAAPGKLAIVGWSYGGYAALQSQVLDPDLFKAVVAVAPVTDLGAMLDAARETYQFRNLERFIGTGPHIEAGSPARHASAFKAPVLMFHGDKDLNVNVTQGRMMRDRLLAAGRTVTYVEFPGLDHQLDNAPARTRLLADSDRFLRKALGIGGN